MKAALRGVEAVIHAATLHKPHVAPHTRQDFVDINITGTLNLLEEAVGAGVRAFVFVSTTSVYSRRAARAAGEPAAWIDETVNPMPKNIYGVTKVAAEGLCELFHQKFKLPCIVLRTSRFFPENDDKSEIRNAYTDANTKLNEFLYRRVDLEDVVDACLAALDRAPGIGLGRYVISATTPFTRSDAEALGRDAPSVLSRCVPAAVDEYRQRGWSMFPTIDRVYDNAKARDELGWRPRHDFASKLADIAAGRPLSSPLARAVETKGYHDQAFADGPFPVED